MEIKVKDKFSINDLDQLKIDQRIFEIGVELQKLRDLEKERDELKKIKAVAIEFHTVQGSYMLEKKEIGLGTNGESKFPLRTEQGSRRYNWFMKYPLLAFSFANLGNVTTFIDSQATETLLYQVSDERQKELSENGRLGRLKWLLGNFVKKGHKAPTSTPVEVES